MSLAPGAAVLYDEPLKLKPCVMTWFFTPVPYDKLVAPVCPEAKLRKLVKNMIYVGVVAKLLEIDMAEVEKAIRKQFAKKVKAANLNLAAVQAGLTTPPPIFTKRDPYFIQRMDKTQGKIIIDGNAAAALGCMFAGVTVVSWYPITPSSSLPETLIEYMKRFRIGADGKATFAIVQAEDELAAIGMVLGAGWAGARAMTATAGPGISLMAEFAGLAYYAEVPGRDLGHPARRSFHRLAHPHLAGRHSLDRIPFARRYQAHSADSVFRGRMLHHGAGRFRSGRAVPDAGVCDVRSRSGHEQLDGGSVQVSREADQSRQSAQQRRSGPPGRVSPATRTWMATASAIAPCPAPIIPAAAYFTRGSGHNEKAQYSERPDDFERNMERLNRKFETARSFVPRPEVDTGKVENRHHRLRHFALGPHRKPRPVAQGIQHRDRLSAAARLSVHPRGARLHRQHDRVYVVEQNRDAQMLSLLKLDLEAALHTRLRSIAHIHGLPLDARSVTDELMTMEGK